MSVRGNARKAYDSYYANWIAQHGEEPTLTIHSMFSKEGEDIAMMLSKGVEQKHLGRVYRRYPVVVLTDGRTVEPSADTRGCWIYVVFESLDKALSYARPMTMREMYEW